MGIDRTQYRTLVSRTLFEIGMNSTAAVRLIMGTVAVESGFRYLKQIGGGPALGLPQIEPATYRWLQRKYRNRIPYIFGKPFKNLEWDLKLGIIIARLRYRVVPDPLPDADDIPALGRYWKLSFNTVHGAGTVRKFTRAYRELVASG